MNRKVETMAKKMTLTPGLETIKAALAEAFGKIEVELKAQLKKAFRADALARFEALMEAAADTKNTGRIGGAWTGFYGWYKYTRYDREGCQNAWRESCAAEPTTADYKRHPGDHPSNYEDLRGTWAKFMSVDYAAADRDANDSFENAKKSFISKNVVKFGNVLGAREVETVTHNFTFTQGCFQGTLAVLLTDGARLRAEVSLKYVIRAIPKVTPYYQYPLNFTGASRNGAELLRPSEEEAKALLA